ncbi:hypothetical protein F2Q68_00030418 [Brassica cretica]|uniref:L-lactate dehydrogenase n=1 Tax=Brassica cretica TaxID=69181 RepID=A0A8S9G4S6_BRACR|nr:hypothetical protein F2Q68_00030418 [Brassica cretica]
MKKNVSSSSFGPGGLDLTSAFFKPILNSDPPIPSNRCTKISVVAVGNVGMAIAQTILTQDLADEIALVDANPDKLRGEAFIVGEHGDSSVALWSSISVGGIPLLSFLEKQQIAYEKQNLEDIHQTVVGSAYEVIKLKGYTSWAIGYSVANLARTILRDQRKIHPVTVLARGFYGVEGGDVFLSLPALLGRNGVVAVTNVHMTDEEAEKLQKSAKTILEMQSQLGL